MKLMDYTASDWRQQVIEVGRPFVVHYPGPPAVKPHEFQEMAPTLCFFWLPHSPATAMSVSKSLPELRGTPDKVA